ncbi:unnamed protein product [Urochloa decumbens]|uniref:F-box domain-containing protein n=1 Tax=Urochloa decumbens TaxID=240449 RepID=A0ABC9GEJ1_9POAL
MAPPPPAPPLLEELEEEVLLRFPPHEPALLVRAALVCKRWCRIVSGSGFRRRFRELNRTPPMLGFLCNTSDSLPRPHSARRMPTSATAARSTPATAVSSSGAAKLEVPSLLVQPSMFSWTAVVLCAACGRCDHLDCHHGPFLVVYMGSGFREAFICTYSSSAGSWSEPIATEQPPDAVKFMRSVLVGNALYFGFLFEKTILKYNLESHEMSVFGVPQTFYSWRHVVLDGRLAVATVLRSKLCIWRKAGPEVDAGWTQNRVIVLETLLRPNNAILTSSAVVGCTDGSGVIFLRAGLVLFTVDLKTYKVKKVCEGKNIYSVIPYMRFYTPAMGAACVDEGSIMCASGAMGAACSLEN